MQRDHPVRAENPGREVFSGREMAAVDFVAAAAALETGVLPCSGGQRRVLRIAASIAGGGRSICGRL